MDLILDLVALVALTLASVQIGLVASWAVLSLMLGTMQRTGLPRDD